MPINLPSKIEFDRSDTLPWQADGIWPDQQQDVNKDEAYYLSATASIVWGGVMRRRMKEHCHPPMATYFWL